MSASALLFANLDKQQEGLLGNCTLLSIDESVCAQSPTALHALAGTLTPAYF